MLVPLETPISYHHVVQETLKYQCLRIGYRLMKYSQDETSFYGIVLNLDKQEQIKFTQNGKIIVLTENLMSYATFQDSTP
ncbi:unnamed protein product [Adineta steineri]|uniref:Uncharacterized protein n=1 Tax=Adineta steineri TaxID=433720 RepID=A0A815LCC8_9BILA|nr:unnamed protein product [Adineta steineri]CAF4049103.1 unnamed protein product [Adineta steineri]